MQRTGIVIVGESGQLMVSVERPISCERCGMCPGGKTLVLPLPSDQGDYKPGDAVTIDMPADKVLKASALTYVLPLALLLIGLFGGYYIAGALNIAQDITAIASGLVLTALGFLIVKLAAPHMQRKGALDMEFSPCKYRNAAEADDSTDEDDGKQ